MLLLQPAATATHRVRVVDVNATVCAVGIDAVPLQQQPHRIQVSAEHRPQQSRVAVLQQQQQQQQQQRGHA